jgi:nicotinic acid phosphoribosyltransferase
VTNDLGHTAFNHVLKMIGADGRPLAKISDAPGRSMCQDELFLGYLMHVFEVSAKATGRTDRAPSGNRASHCKLCNFVHGSICSLR